MTLLGGHEKREIRIEDYSDKWPERFKAQELVIREALGSSALRVEHIGSTSVKGLGAKPIVDILLVVEDSSRESTYLPQLEAAGYILRVREPDFHEHRMLRTRLLDVHLHVYSIGSPEIDRHLLFRDRLRANTSEREAYEKLKRALSKQDWPDMDAYAAAKTKFIEGIIAAAQS
jgi:GrpB-like predicted nucleotidyltransferase (UPF0157 family)